MTPDPELRVLIVDDEPLSRDYLRRAVEQAGGARVVGECRDGGEAVEAIEAAAPDVVLLDIRMPEVGGFDVLESVGADRMPEVVFVTAHEEYTLRAFEVHALDYVLKPYEPARIRDALDHVRSRIRSGVDARLRERLEALVGEMERRRTPGSAGPPRKLTVRAEGRVYFVDVDDVDWIEADGNGVKLHTGGGTHAVRVPLGRLSEYLGAARFIRIHRSAVVNLDRVVEVVPWGHGDHVAVLRSGERLRVSRTYKDALLELVH